MANNASIRSGSCRILLNRELLIGIGLYNYKTNCTLCGLCKPTCPAYNVLFDEAISPRGKAVLLKSNALTKHLHVCTLCKACEVFCTVPEIDLVEKIIKAREKMIESGQETAAGRKLIDNIKKYGNAIGPVESGKTPNFFSC